MNTDRSLNRDKLCGVTSVSAFFFLEELAFGRHVGLLFGRTLFLKDGSSSLLQRHLLVRMPRA